MIPARSERSGLEEEIRRASHVWFAAIAGAHLSQLTPEAHKKIDQVILVDPDSELMKSLATIQSYRGPRFAEEVRGAIELCKSEAVKRVRDGREIGVKLVETPVLNVVLFDPGTPHAWARVQEFIPHFPGQESVAYAIRKEEWEGLYNKIESSFKQTWENGRDPNK